MDDSLLNMIQYTPDLFKTVSRFTRASSDIVIVEQWTLPILAPLLNSPSQYFPCTSELFTWVQQLKCDANSVNWTVDRQQRYHMLVDV